MIFAPQRAAAALGKGGCYVLCIFRWVEKLMAIEINPLNEFVRAVERERVAPDAYVNMADILMADFTGGTWEVLKAGDGKDSRGRPYDLPLSYQCKPGELEIDRYEVEGETDGHFIHPDGWDPYGESRAVREGRLVSKRIFRRIK
jgi:hypothetical protein